MDTYTSNNQRKVRTRCINHDCESFLNDSEQVCPDCGTIQYEMKTENDPFHFAHTQIERQYEDKDTLQQQIQQYINQTREIFDWVSEDDVSELKIECDKLLQNQCASKKKNVVKNIIAALVFDLIRRKKDLNSGTFIRKLMLEFKIKSRDLFEYLQKVDRENQSINELVNDQLQQFEDSLRKFLQTTGQILLFQLKMENLEYKKLSYVKLTEHIISKVSKSLLELYQLDIVKQFCQSKKPSKCLISLGYTALKLNQIHIIPHEYCQLFNTNAGTLKFFSQGLWNSLVHEIERFQKGYDKRKKIEIDSVQSRQSQDELKFIKKDQTETTLSTGAEMKHSNTSIVDNISEEYQMKVIRQFLECQLDQYMKFQKKMYILDENIIEEDAKKEVEI